jgi:hypothetical protein
VSVTPALDSSLLEGLMGLAYHEWPWLPLADGANRRDAPVLTRSG